MSGNSTRPPSGGVRRQRKQQTRQALLAAARRVLRRRGLAGLTTRDVAAEANVAAGTFFVHFPDLNTLIETLLDEHIGRALEAAMRTLPPAGDLVGRLVHVAGELYASYDREPDLARQYLSASLFHANPQGPTDRRMAEFRRWVTGELEEAVSVRAVALPESDLLFTAFFSLYFGILVAGLRGELDRAAQLRLLEASLTRIITAKHQREQA
ncbi:TetR/AcrR family transcriptional regulator [Streptomyces sp. CNQ085]|uniref:TetR/AcrR family transcriptional regulator n=1 Tax=Streptomyces sp. CNQ085 TaxID=2886944 RepID=UPI001F507930|nr:TetR/AcrR family transcriptional regulator [Streptomyces sp. CNQ085]MCI0384345.1 TetR/AcrR family transcriptional regulator [Streptomyces sp. CNQ085]